MVNNNNLVPIEAKKPVETVLEIEKYEIKKSPLSVVARNKVISKSGSDYVSENKEGYGPGNSQSSPSDIFPSFRSFSGSSNSYDDYGEPLHLCLEREQRERRRQEELDRTVAFLAKTTAKVATVSAITTVTGGWAPVVGGSAWLGGRFLESKNDEFLQFLGRSMGDLGGDVFSGGFFSNSTVGELAGKSGIDLKKLENFFEMKGHAETGWAIMKHDKHRNEGKSYKSDCELCNLHNL